MKITNVNVYGLEESIIGSSYPMMTERPTEDEFEAMCYDLYYLEDLGKVGDNKKYKRAKSLGNTAKGEAHDQFLTGIIVQFDIDFTIKAWTEAERYHFLDFVSSMSTMHKLTKFDLDNAYIEYVDDRVIEIMKDLQEQYNESPTTDNYLKLIYTNPTGMKLTARMTTNYRQLKTIFSQRQTHRLPEWREACDWMLTLPMFKELTGVENGK